MSDLIERLQKMSVCVYLATEEAVAADISDGLKKAIERIAELERLAPMCDEHGKGEGTRGGCPYCALLKQSSIFSRIDYLCEEPNEQQVSSYDIYCNEDAVLEGVKRKFAELEAEVARLRVDGEDRSKSLMLICGERDFAINDAERLRSAAAPFANLVKSSSGSIPTERLSFADWHELTKAVDWPLFNQGNADRKEPS